MNYHVTKRENPLNRQESLFYPQPEWGKMISEEELAEEISYASSINAPDIRAVITSLKELIPRHTMAGDTVKLDNFGIFRQSFEAKGKAKEEDVNSSDILNSKLLFRPAVAIKNKLKATIYKKVAAAKKEVAEPTD